MNFIALGIHGYQSLKNKRDKDLTAVYCQPGNHKSGWFYTCFRREWRLLPVRFRSVYVCLSMYTVCNVIRSGRNLLTRRGGLRNQRKGYVDENVQSLSWYPDFLEVSFFFFFSSWLDKTFFSFHGGNFLLFPALLLIPLLHKGLAKICYFKFTLFENTWAQPCTMLQRHLNLF